MSQQSYLIRYSKGASESIQVNAGDPIEAAFAFYRNAPSDRPILVKEIRSGELYEFDRADFEAHYPEFSKSPHPKKKFHVFESSLEKKDISHDEWVDTLKRTGLTAAVIKLGLTALVAAMGFVGVYYYVGQGNGNIVNLQFDRFDIDIPEAWKVENEHFLDEETYRVWLETIHNNQIIIYATARDTFLQRYSLIEKHGLLLTRESQAGGRPSFGRRVSETHFGLDCMVEPFLIQQNLASIFGKLMVTDFVAGDYNFYIVMIIRDDYMKVWASQLGDILDSIRPYASTNTKH